MKEFYYLNHQKLPQGPYTLDTLARQMVQGRVTPMTLVACKGATNWVPLGSLLSGREENEAHPDERPPLANCPACGVDLSALAEYQPAFCPTCGASLVPPSPITGLWGNFTQSLRHYARFRGRATRAEFWSFQLINALIFISLYFIATLGIFYYIGVEKLLEAQEYDTLDSLLNQAIEGEHGLALSLSIIIPFFCMVVWAFLMFIPQLSVTIRRLHDAGWSGKWLLPHLALGITSLSFFFNQESELAGNHSHLQTFLGTLFELYGFFLLALLLLDSRRGTTPYGPSTKYPQG